MILVFTLTAASLILLWEMRAPRRALQGELAWRWSNNLALSALSHYVATVANTALLGWLGRWAEVNQIGLFQHVSAPAPLVFLTLLVASQFVQYLQHVAFHRYAWLWPIHAVHHSDVDMDVTTSYRHHPLEALLVLPLVSPLILLLGVPGNVAIAYALFVVGATLFSHANVRLPRALETVLRPIILTPDFHRLHHCAEARYTNSNYGSVVPWFDYLFGTARSRPFEEQETMPLGLEYLREPGDNRLDKLLWEPVQIRKLLAAREQAAH